MGGESHAKHNPRTHNGFDESSQHIITISFLPSPLPSFSTSSLFSHPLFSPLPSSSSLLPPPILILSSPPPILSSPPSHPHPLFSPLPILLFSLPPILPPGYHVSENESGPSSHWTSLQTHPHSVTQTAFNQFLFLQFMRIFYGSFIFNESLSTTKFQQLQ